MSKSSPPAICPASVCPATPNMPTAQFDTPFKAHAGRFLDSSSTRDYQQPLRTLRARGVTYSAARKRIYMIMGSTVAVYNTDRLFGGYLGTPISNGPVSRYPAAYTEQYLPWDYSFYAEDSGSSGWITPTTDGQTRLFSIDADDRGYVYIGTDTFGWGILTDTGNSLSNVKQILSENYAVPLKYVGVFKNGTKYYAIVGDSTGSLLYDVTIPAAPVLMRQLSFGALRFAYNADRSVIAIANTSQTAYVYTASALASGGNPSAVITSNNAIAAVTSDGSDFFFGTKESNSSKFVITRVNGTNFSTSSTTITTDVPLQPFDIRYGDQYLTVNGSGYVKLYKVEANGSYTELPITSFLRKYYIQPDTGYSKPDGYTSSIIDVYFMKYGGKSYLFYSGHGMGDVYEMQGGDTIENHINAAASWGTQNPNNPNKAQGPYYGDLVSFGSTGTGQSASAPIHWDFGNSESGAANAIDTNVGVGVAHRYTNITSAALITAAKKVTITGTVDPSLTGFTNVTLKAPSARITMPFTGGSYTFPGTLSPLIVTGDQFFDASDGTVEGHYATWTFDAANSTGTPTESIAAGQCGSHSLSLLANYIPYTGTGASIAPVSGFLNYAVNAGPVTYTVQPFTAKVAIQGSTSTNVTFVNNTRVGSAATFTSAAAAPDAGFLWEVLDASDTPIAAYSQTTPTTQSISTPSTFTIPKTTNGAKVRLTITMDPALIADASCTSSNVAVAEFRLVSPDPVVDASACANPTANGPCTLTAKSVTAQDQTNWSYQWYMDSVLVPGATTATYSPGFTAQGSHTIYVAAATPIGNGSSAPVTLNVQPQTCNGAVPPGILTITPSCNSCSSGATVSFSMFAWGYTLQPCDVISWNFGDNSAIVTTKSASHTFSDGTWHVTLSVSNPNNATPSTATVTITVGQVTPPPPTCPTSAPKDGAIFADFSGNAGCGANKPCNSGEVVAFSASAWGYTFQSCDSYSWEFGDGSFGSGKSTSHVYSTAGTYTAKVTVSNTLGSAYGTSTVTVQGTAGCTAPKDGGIFVAYSGPVTTCTATNGKSCNDGETIAFTAQTFGYTFQNCDTLTWNFGDNTSATGATATHKYAASTWNGNLTVRNTSGQVVVPFTVKVIPAIPAPDPPRVTITPTATTIAIGGTVTFVGTATPADGITAWNWTLANASGAAVSTWSNQGTVVYKFLTAGAYDMKLTASNLGGTSAPAIVRVNVNANTFTYLLPVVAHAPGQNGSRWRTDLQIYSPSYDPNSPSELSFEFKGATTKLKPNSSTKIYEDFLQTLTGTDDAGPVIVRGTDAVPPQMWTRTYTVSPSGVGTYGQLIPAIPLDAAQQSVDQARSYIVSGVEVTTRYRTNLGIVNPNTSPVTVTVKAFDDSQYGIVLGDFQVTVQPLQLLQINDLSIRIPDTAKGKPFSLKVTPTTPVQIIAYGSMVDQISNDPVYIPAVSDSDQSSPDLKTQILPGVGHLQQDSGTWRSDVTIFNPDSQGVIFNMTYYDSTGTKLAEADTIPLSGNAFLRLQDVLRSPILPSPPADSFGVLKVETVGSTPAKYPVVVSRTYKDRDVDGTFGQGIPAVAQVRGNVTVGKSAVIPGVRSDLAYYTNLGLVALGTQPTRVQVTLLDKTTGLPVGAPWERTYADGKPNPLFANESIIARDIIRGISSTADAGTLKITVLEGGPVWAYASVVDQKTSDPEYVPATPMD